LKLGPRRPAESPLAAFAAIGACENESGLSDLMMKWILVMLRIALYFVLGVALLYSPWIPLWMSNFFLVHYEWVSAIGHNDYVRGAVSGIGLADIWLAFEEIRRLSHSADKGAPR
jgi:hypothetical protein